MIVLCLRCVRPLPSYLLSCLLSVLFLSFSTKSSAQRNLPKYSDYRIPASAPTAPGEMFKPPMSGDALNGTPLCGEWTRTAGPDESLIISGDLFSTFTGVDAGKDSRFKVYSTSGFHNDASIQRLEKDKAVLTLDQSIPRWGMYLVWPGNNSGYGKPIAINKTESWWVGPEQVSKGEKISVYGRNLSSFNDSTKSYVYLKAVNGGGQWLKVTSVNPYKVEAVLPDNLANGDYEIWAHNGHGGEYGWSGPLKLAVKTEEAWSKITFNVKNYGAKGNGLNDDTKAIKAALDAAKKSPGCTVYFPEGTYMVSSDLNPSNYTRWNGAGKNKSIIKCRSGYRAAEAMVYGVVNTFQISNLSFDANKNYRGLHSEPIFLRGSSNLKIDNVNFNCLNYNVLQLDNTYMVSLTNCEVIGKISFLGKASQLFVDRCKFYLTNDTELALHTWAGVGISLTNSSCQDYNNKNAKDGSGWGKGRFFVGAGNAGSGGCTYIANNTTYDLSVRKNGSVDQNSGEQYLWEGFASIYSGSVSSSSETTTTLNGFSLKPDTRKYAVITKGRGMGQARKIIAINGSKITLESPWNLTPDKSSTIAIGHYADRIVMYKNRIDGKTAAVNDAEHNASSGIQPYGGIFNFIADGNYINEVRAGIANWSTQHTKGVDPNYFNLFVNNNISNCRFGIQNGIDHYRKPETALLGNTFRNNIINNTVESGIVNTVMETTEPVLQHFVYEHNRFINVKKGFSTGGDIGLPNGFPKEGKGIENQIFFKNHFSGNGSLPGIQVVSNIALRENTYTGFRTLYAGNQADAVLEAPQHVVEINGKVGEGTVKSTFSVWNSGTKNLGWKISKNASWLSLTEAEGSIENESKSHTLTLTANPESLAAGTHVADITISSAKKTSKYQVIFNLISSNAPTINITSPEQSATLTNPSSVTITAEASDAVSKIQKVEFYANDKKIGEDIISPYSLAWESPAIGNYKLTAKAINSKNIVAVSDLVELSIVKGTQSCAGTGSLNWEYWTNIRGNDVRAIPLDEQATGTRKITTFSSPTSFADNYGSRARGYICVPVSGEYIFYISSDDKSELWLSTSDEPSGKKKIAFVNEWTTPGDYAKFASQESKAIYLNSGQRYYIEALHKEGNADKDHVSVGWKLPDGTVQRPISGNYLIPYDEPEFSYPTIILTSPEEETSITIPASVTIKADAYDNDGSIRKVEFFANETKLGEDSSSPYTLTWQNPTAGSFEVKAKATNNQGLSSFSNTVPLQIKNAEQSCSGTGSIEWEYWTDISGNNVSTIPVNNQPNGVKRLSSFASPVSFGDKYGSRIRGYICPPASGNYVFYISGDDNSELWLSTNDNVANKKRIAYTKSWTLPGDYHRYSTQHSANIYLQAGQRYYIEALHKEGDGDKDHLSVGWKLPDGSLQRPILGSNLIPFERTVEKPRFSLRSFSDELSIPSQSPTNTTNYIFNAYPNPFSQHADIEFNVKESGKAELYIFNIQGMLIQKLYDGDVEAGRTYTYRFDGRRKSPGTYVAKLVVGKQVQTKVLVLLN